MLTPIEAEKLNGYRRWFGELTAEECRARAAAINAELPVQRYSDWSLRARFYRVDMLELRLYATLLEKQNATA